MRPRTKVLLLAAIIIAGLAFFCLRKPEPSHEGKSLSEWLQENKVVYNNGAEQLSEETKVALQKMGTNVIPYLVERIGRTNSSFKKEIYDFCKKHDLPDVDLSKVYEEQVRATTALKVFGGEARCAIPSLTALLNNEETAFSAACALVNIGPDAMPAMTNALSSTNRITLGAVSYSLRFAGTNAIQAFPALLANLTNTNPDTRMYSVRTLGYLRFEASKSLPRLTEAISDIVPSVRREAIHAIGKYNTNATYILPVLADLITNPDRLTQNAAIKSIKDIEGTNCFLRFTDWLASTNAEIRGAGVRALFDYASTNRNNQIALAALLQSTNENIRTGATNVLEKLDPGGRRRRRNP